MKHSDILFDLIKSLHKSEKRFFKLLGGLQQGDKNYLRLFDAMEKQPQYDERDFLSRYSQEPFSQNFS